MNNTRSTHRSIQHCTVLHCTYFIKGKNIDVFGPPSDSAVAVYSVSDHQVEGEERVEEVGRLPGRVYGAQSRVSLFQQTHVEVDHLEMGG